MSCTKASRVCGAVASDRSLSGSGGGPLHFSLANACGGLVLGLPAIAGELGLAVKTHMAKLYFHYSTMNAGKSTALLQASHNYREGGMQTYLITARLDNRAGQGRIASRWNIRRSFGVG